MNQSLPVPELLPGCELDTEWTLLGHEEVTALVLAGVTLARMSWHSPWGMLAENQECR